MGVQSIAGGNATTRVPNNTSADDAQRRADRDNRARRGLSSMALNLHPGAREGNPKALLAARLWRDEMYAVLGLDGGDQ